MSKSNTVEFYCCLLLLLITAASCSDRRNRGDTAIALPPLEDVHTLETSFDWTDVPEDFILARPGGIAIDMNGEILILDEDYIKVFDINGVPKRLMGGPGEGPGEFQSVRILWCSPDGYYTVFGGTFGYTAHFFRPDHTYINRVNYMSYRPFQEIMHAQDLRPSRPEVVYNLGEHDRVYSIDSQHIDRNRPGYKKVFLFHESPDSLSLIAEYQQTNYVRSERSGMSMPFLGRLLVVALSRGRIAYSHTWLDKAIGEESSTYTIVIYDTGTRQKTTIVHPFKPKEINWEVPAISEEYRDSSPDGARSLEEVNKLAKERCDEHVYLAPLTTLLVDRNYLLAYLDHPRSDFEPGEIHLYQVDIFDVEDGSYVSSAYLPYGTVLHDGYLYGLHYSPDEGSNVVRYSIDQQIYRRRR